MATVVNKADTRNGKTAVRSSIAPGAIDAEAADESNNTAESTSADDARSDVETLSAELGPSTESEVKELVGDVSDVELQQAGARVATPRISKEAARILRVSQTFFSSASPALVAAVCMSPAVLRVLAWSAAQGHIAWRNVQSKRAAKRTAKATSATSGTAATDAARGARDQLADALRKVAGRDTTQLKRINTAVQPSAQGEVETGPGKALKSLVAIGRAYLKNGSKAEKNRCAMWGVTAARLDDAATIAQRALTHERAEGSPAEDLAHEQANVDRWDGLNLVLIEQVVSAFAKARATGKGVPQMGYVHLRGILGTRKTPRKAAPTPPTPPANP